MKLFLIRHGDADMASNDDARRLSARGREEAATMGAWLKRYDLRLPTVWHSNKVRTQETASILNEHAGWGSTLLEVEGLRPNSEVGPIAMKVAADDKDLVIVGHMPFMSLMASAMVSEGGAQTYWDFETCGVLVLQRAGDHQWIVDAYISPNKL